jgi:SH3 domain-containing YSC84-like protein 1
MKKLLTFSLIAILGAASVRAGDAHTPRSDLVVRVETCEAILREFMANPATAIPAASGRRPGACHDPEPVQGRLHLRRQGRLRRHHGEEAGGHWSLPVLIDASEASLGLQVGAKSVDTVCIMTDDATPRLLFTNRFNIGVDAKAVAGPSSAEYENDAKKTFIAPVLVYSRSVGLYAGATVKAGHVERNDPPTSSSTTRPTRCRAALQRLGDAPPEVQPLMAYVQQLAP